SGEEGEIPIAARKDPNLGREESAARGELRQDLDPDSPQLSLDDSRCQLPESVAGGGHEAKREPLAGADIDAVIASPAAVCLEEPPHTSGLVSIHAPVRPVEAALRQEPPHLEWSKLWVERVEELTHECAAIHAVGERAAHERPREQGVSLRHLPNGDLLPEDCRYHLDCESPVITKGSQLRLDLRVDHVDPSAAERVYPRAPVAGNETVDDAVEVCLVRSPVAGVTNERELSASLVLLNNEWAIADRCACRRVVDRIRPHVVQVLAYQGVPGQNPVEQLMPGAYVVRNVTRTVFASTASTRWTAW